MANQNQCCCDTKMLIAETASQNRYDALKNTNDINAVTIGQTQKILDALSQSKIEALQGKVAQLELANQMQGVVRYPASWTWSAVPIWDKWGYPITTDRLCTRKCYVGRYIESATPHITLTNALSNNASNGVLGG